MKIEITNVIDNGTHDSERVVLSVLQDTDLKYYIIRDTTYTDDEHVSNKWQHVHKFGEQPVKAGDEVILYTKKGKKEIKNHGNNNKQYTYYWGMDSSIWNNDGDAAVLYQIYKWKTFNVKKVAN